MTPNPNPVYPTTPRFERAERARRKEAEAIDHLNRAREAAWHVIAVCDAIRDAAPDPDRPIPPPRPMATRWRLDPLPEEKTHGRERCKKILRGLGVSAAALLGIDWMVKWIGRVL